MVLHLPDAEERDQLISENKVDPLANDQTILDDEEVNEAQIQYEDILKEEEGKKKRVPKGTSSYQAAWIAESDDEKEGSEGNNTEDEGEEQMVCLSLFCNVCRCCFEADRAGLFSTQDDDIQSKRGDEPEEEDELEDVDVDNRTAAEDEDFDEEEHENDFQRFLTEKGLHFYNVGCQNSC